MISHNLASYRMSEVLVWRSVSPAELVPVSSLRHGHHRVHHRRPDVGAHDDRDGCGDLQHCRKSRVSLSSSSLLPSSS